MKNDLYINLGEAISKLSECPDCHWGPWCIDELNKLDTIDNITEVVDTLREAILQIDYLHGRLGEVTGSGNTVIARCNKALASLLGLG